MSKFHPNVRPKENSIRIYSFTHITSLSSSPNLFTNNTPLKNQWQANKSTYSKELQFMVYVVHELRCGLLGEESKPFHSQAIVL